MFMDKSLHLDKAMNEKRLVRLFVHHDDYSMLPTMTGTLVDYDSNSLTLAYVPENEEKERVFTVFHTAIAGYEIYWH